MRVLRGGRPNVLVTTGLSTACLSVCLPSSRKLNLNLGGKHVAIMTGTDLFWLHPRSACRLPSLVSFSYRGLI
ncbi:uncharacterized protein BDW47DRAFT_106078, partial [Aspergillus candidus]